MRRSSQENNLELLGDISPRHRSIAEDEFALFEDLYPKLRRFAAVVADLDLDPDDLVQEALALTLSRQNLREIDQPAAYLKRAIVNLVSNNRRRAGRFRNLVPRIATEDSTIDYYPSDLAILDELAPLDRAVVYLADVERLPHHAIAAELDLTAAAVRKRASRARRQLRQHLGENITSISGGSKT